MKAGETRKAVRCKRVSKIARGRFAKQVVFKGRKKKKTSAGLATELLMKKTENAEGRRRLMKKTKVVPKESSAVGMKAFRNVQDCPLSTWFYTVGARSTIAIAINNGR